ncbi:MAG: CbtA family protein [Bryobacteraceae bacterium]
MDRFRVLMAVILLSGTIAGLLLFVAQHYTTFPLIEKAEVYESAGMHHEDEGWKPADGTERTLFTVLTTILAGIGFAALLFGILSLKPVSLNWKKGMLWGIAAFICIDVAPAFGLPPMPPGVPVADIYARQLWWVAAVLCTAVALWLLLDRSKSVPVRLIGLLLVILPYAIGAPVAKGESAVPASLIHQFATASILTTGMFWIALGSIGGLLSERFGYRDA